MGTKVSHNCISYFLLCTYWVAFNSKGDQRVLMDDLDQGHRRGGTNQPLAARSINTGSLLERWILTFLQGVSAGEDCCCGGGGGEGGGRGRIWGLVPGDADTICGLPSRTEYRHVLQMLKEERHRDETHHTRTHTGCCLNSSLIFQGQF